MVPFFNIRTIQIYNLQLRETGTRFSSLNSGLRQPFVFKVFFLQCFPKDWVFQTLSE